SRCRLAWTRPRSALSIITACCWCAFSWRPIVAEVVAVQTLPVLPIKNTVLFPQLFLPLSVGRPSSVAAVEAALASEEKTLVIVAQGDVSHAQPGPEQLYGVGTRALIKKMARGPQGVEMLVQGVGRVVLAHFEQTEPYLEARVEPLPFQDETNPETEALYR